MSADRMRRVNKNIMEVLATLVPGAIKDPRVHEVSMMSVVEVKATPDLRYAKVYLSVLGDPDAVQAAVSAVSKAAGFLRHELGQKIRMRYTPELQFVLDDRLDAAADIDRILNEIKGESDQG